MENTFDVVIIGGGPGGVAAAQILSAAGKTVALTEETHLGGICLNHGCIPTKFFLAASAPLGLLREHARFGVLKGELAVDFDALQKRKERFVKGSSQALGKSLQASGVTLFSGRGRLEGAGVVRVEGEHPHSLQAKDVILATGSHSTAFPGMAPDGKSVLDSSMLLALQTPPRSLLIVGGGAIGIEFSDFFASLGADVTIVEGMPHLLPSEDEDIAAELAKIMKKSGRTCITGRQAASVTSREDGAELRFADGETISAEKALIAVGRRANSSGLGLETVGGALDERGFVRVDKRLQAAPHCYAVGDVNGLALLAHAAEHQGTWAARHILGKENGDYDSGPIPACVFGHTEVMRVGKTAREAAESGETVFVSKAPFSLNPIAQAHGSSVGFAKAVWQGGQLAGMAAVGHGASHLVTAAQLLVLGKFDSERLHEFMFAHPTLDEILRSAVNAPRKPYPDSTQ